MSRQPKRKEDRLGWFAALCLVATFFLLGLVLAEWFTG